MGEDAPIATTDDAKRRAAPCGTWPSPLGADAIAAGAIGVDAVAIDATHAYWSETRPIEGGRTTLVRRGAEGRDEELIAAPASARSRVHEYGGGAIRVDGSHAFFSNDGDRRIYRLDLGASGSGAAAVPLTPAGPWRYADFALDTARGRLITVREDHTPGRTEPVNTLVSIDLRNENPGNVLVSGHDFYATPRLDPERRRIAWLAWRHPHMPWEETELWHARVADDGSLSDAHCIAGGGGESVFQPTWSPDGTLYFVSDRSGWWNLYRWGDGAAVALHPIEAEVGVPQWAFDLRTFGFASPDEILFTYGRAAVWRLARLSLGSGAVETFDLPFVRYDSLRVGAGRALFVGGSAVEPAALIELDLASGRHRTIRSSSALSIDPGHVSVAIPIEVPSARGRTAHAFYYPPRNGRCAVPEGELPPLRVRSHGGPTSATDGSFKLAIQYWTSRGFAVVDVNYGGSSGYGRAYRHLLDGAWGVVDVEDCAHAARHLIAQGLADPRRTTISGSSAGGYTTLCALTFTDDFSAGASHYGIGDLEAIARDTHKFEKHYTDTLIAPYPAAAELYRERSPIHHAERLSCPVIFFQGLDDRVVPPAQAETMVAALRDKGIPVAYLPFAGEGHGFRRAETIQRALEAELLFFGRVLGFTPADPIAPIPIAGLDIGSARR